MQLRTMREHAKRRDWSIVVEIRDIASGTSVWPRREELIQSARRRELDVILVWRLDRWGRSLLDLIGSLQELNELGVGFVSLSEARHPPPPAVAYLAGTLAGFERDILRDRVRPESPKRAGTPPPCGKEPIRFVRFTKTG